MDVRFPDDPLMNAVIERNGHHLSAPDPSRKFLRDSIVKQAGLCRRVYDDADEFGRTGLVAVATAPYYAVEIKPAILGTLGGILINEDAAVVNEGGEAIPNLYAAGEVANSAFFYKEYPASGSSISTGWE